jgi:cytochrome c-type biogenesis protein CcmH
MALHNLLSTQKESRRSAKFPSANGGRKFMRNPIWFFWEKTAHGIPDKFAALRRIFRNNGFLLRAHSKIMNSLLSHSLRLALLGVVLSAGSAVAVQPGEMLADAALEARARVISEDLRCLVCQNQSIDDSDADLAHDLRVLVRQRLQAGDSDAQVKQYLVDRYGDYVLLNPPFKTATLALWLGAPALLAMALLAALLFYRRRRATTLDPARPLSPEEQQRLARVLNAQPTGKETQR